MQIDLAFRHFCHSVDLKGVSLMMWPGTNLRSRGLRLYERDDPDCYETALEIDACGESLDVLKRLNPDSNLDDLSELLFLASLRVREEMVRYLLDLGAAPTAR